MRTAIPARPEPAALPKDLTQVINRALRDAALAPTQDDALDVTGDALRAIAHIARYAQSAALRSGQRGVPLPACRPDLLTAVQRACLLFSLIEAASESVGGQTLTLARIGRSLMADVGHQLARPAVSGSIGAASEVRHG